ncbi:MAG: ATP-binding protein [Planctomycetes bacterium]|nr:ATP-binding protein [Planctomycetota bacterium]
MSRHLDDFLRLQREAVRALRESRREPARRALHGASDALARLAAESPAPQRGRRLRESEELRAAARRLDPPRRRRVEGRDPGGDEPARSGFRIAERPPVRLSDVAGLEPVKEQFRLKLVYPFLHPEKARRYRLRRGGGILLYGPPGTGKTLLARALAGEIDAAFLTVKPSEILSKWVGEAEKNVEGLFEEARSYPVSVIFVDEIDALAPRRSESTSPVMARLVPQILAEMEGFEQHDESCLLFLGATNEPWLLDPAILRPGRFDESIYIGLPDRAALDRLLDIHLEGRPVAGDLDRQRLAAALRGFTGADVQRLCERAASEAFLDSVERSRDRAITTEDLLRLAASSSPSVPPSAVARFDAYAARRGGRTGGFRKERLEEGAAACDESGEGVRDDEPDGAPGVKRRSPR